MTDVRLGDVMTADPLTVAPSESLAEAAASMRERSVGSCVVVQNGDVLGIITERDLVKATADGAHPTESTVESWMTRDPIMLGPGAGITNALEQMLDHNFRHVPIVDGDKLVGIVSLRQLIGAARIRKVDPWSPGTGRGLENVTVAETELSYIDGQQGRLVYRGYSAVDLARRCSFEEVWHLLYVGELPSDDTFAGKIAENRSVPLDRDTINDLAKTHGGYMATLQAAVAATGAVWGLRAWLNQDPAQTHVDALRLGAVVPTLVAAIWRAEQNLDPIEADPNLGHAENYLWMLNGEKPTPEQVTALTRYLILTADHGMNASTFTGRVIASTGSDLGMSVAGALGALAGPLHGGAPSLVADMLDAIGTADKAEAWIKGELAAGRRIMGFGHRVYKTEDPRGRCLRETGDELGAERIELAKQVEQVALKAIAEKNPAYAYMNVEFYSAIVLERAGIPRPLFTPTFAVSRTVGWTAHMLEQVRDNRLIRPTAQYVGPTDRKLE
jgi:citrate synthase